jgi:hypothetical protein
VISALARRGFGRFHVGKELPAGRRPIVTHVCATEAERSRAYERIREELRAGRQAFVVCPLVEESEALQVRAATAEYERLKAGELKEFEVVLLHGQMRPREKQEAMAAFAAGLVGAMFSFLTSIQEASATIFLTRGGWEMMPVGIFTFYIAGSQSQAAALGVILIAMCALSLLVVNRIAGARVGGLFG